MSERGYDGGAGGIRAHIVPVGLARTSLSHWLRVAGVLIAMTIVGAGWAQTEARSPRKDPPKDRKSVV